MELHQTTTSNTAQDHPVYVSNASCAASHIEGVSDQVDQNDPHQTNNENNALTTMVLQNNPGTHPWPNSTGIPQPGETTGVDQQLNNNTGVHKKSDPSSYFHVPSAASSNWMS